MEGSNKKSSSEPASNKKSSSDPAPPPATQLAPTPQVGSKKSASEAAPPPSTTTSAGTTTNSALGSNKRSITEPASALRGSSTTTSATTNNNTSTWRDQRLSMERKLLLKHRTDEAERDESVELSSTPIPHDAPDSAKHFNLLPETVYENHRLLESIARHVNTSLGTPEVVLVGYRSHGKTSILEALTGQLIGNVAFATQEGATKRPIYYQFINTGSSSSSSTPKCIIQFDTLTKERNLEIPLKNLSKEIARRCSKITSEPLYVTLKAPNTLNMTFIDTPGLLGKTEDLDTKAQIESIVLSVCNESESRLVICVEEAASWKDTTLLPFVKRIDPSHFRTCIVFTKFFSLRSVLLSREGINRYLNGGKNQVLKCFWVSVPSSKVRGKCNDGASWQKAVWQAHYRDRHFFETLKAKKKYINNIGILSFRRYIMKEIWKLYLDQVPHALQVLQKRHTDLQQELKVNKEGSTMNTQSMRTLANSYLGLVLQSLNRVVHGSSEAEPSVMGQTLEEEVYEQGNIEWVDKTGTLIRLKTKWEVPFQDCKLYGGQQFDRLLAEFKAVSDNLELEEEHVSVVDLTSAVGTKRTSEGFPDCLWGACILAHQRIHELYLPLVNTVIQRMVYIMRRSFDISAVVVQANWRKLNSESTQSQACYWEGRTGSSFSRKEREREENRPIGIKAGIGGVRGEATRADNIEQYPYFTGFVKELFEQHLFQIAMDCKKRCLEEVHSPETLYWAYSADEEELPAASDNEADLYDKAFSLTRNIFVFCRRVLTRSIVLRLYSFFLNSFEREVQEILESKIQSLEPSALERKFQTSHVLKKLVVDSMRVGNELDLCTKNTETFRKASTDFSVALVTELQFY